MKRKILMQLEEILTLPDLNSKETPHVTTYLCESLFKTFNLPSSRVAPSFISKTVHELYVKVTFTYLGLTNSGIQP